MNAPTTDLDDQLRPALGGIDAGADEFGASLPVPKDFYFSTTGSTNPPGVAGTADDARGIAQRIADVVAKVAP